MAVEDEFIEAHASDLESQVWIDCTDDSWDNNLSRWQAARSSTKHSDKS